MNALLITAGINHLSAAALERFLLAGQIQLWHAIVLLALAALVARTSAATGITPLITGAGWTITIGVAFFSGSLYWLAFKGAGSLSSAHWITPLGGLLLITGWGLIIVAGMKSAA